MLDIQPLSQVHEPEWFTRLQNDYLKCLGIDMKEIDKATELREKCQETRKYLEPDAEKNVGLRLTLKLLVDYIEFMVTPCAEDPYEDS
jgi:hypothetical protein